MTSPPPPKAGDGPEDGVERGVQIIARVFDENTQDMTADFPEQRVLAAVTAAGGRIG